MFTFGGGTAAPWRARTLTHAAGSLAAAAVCLAVVGSLASGGRSELQWTDPLSERGQAEQKSRSAPAYDSRARGRWSGTFADSNSRALDDRVWLGDKEYLNLNSRTQVLNLRTTTSQKYESVPRRARM